MYKSFVTVLILFLISCKGVIEKTPLDDVITHEWYQDSIIGRKNDTVSMFLKIDSLVGLYQAIELEKKEDNANYHYYLGRIYGKVDSIDFYRYFYDSVKREHISFNLYNKYKQASYTSFRRAYLIDPLHLDALSSMIDLLFVDEIRFKKHRDQTIYLHYDPKGVLNDNVVKNWRSIYYKDTSAGKTKSRKILERVFLMYNDQHFKSSFTFSVGDKEKPRRIIEYAELAEILNSDGGVKVIDKVEFNSVRRKVVESVNKARLEIDRQEKLAAIELERKKEIERRERNIREYGDQYIGTWTSDQSRLTIFSNGKYSVRYFDIDAEGEGVWECDGTTISFSKTSGEHVAFMYESAYGRKVAVLNYYNVFAPTLCLEGLDGHVDFCFKNHTK